MGLCLAAIDQLVNVSPRRQTRELALPYAILAVGSWLAGASGAATEACWPLEGGSPGAGSRGLLCVRGGERS